MTRYLDGKTFQGLPGDQDKYAEGWERVFGKKKSEVTCTHDISMDEECEECAKLPENQKQEQEK